MPEIRRILVVLEPASAQGAVPELATRIAARSAAKIDAILVQDAALMTAADLPFTQEILATTGVRRGLTRQSLELDFMVLARNLALRFEDLAGRAGLRWQLRSVRGRPMAEIAAASAECDLFLLGQPRNASLSLAAVRKLADAARRPAIFLGDLASPLGGLSVLDGEAEDLESLIKFLAPVFTGTPALLLHPSPTELTDLRRRTVLVLPGRSPGPSDGGPNRA
ncbi:hypothetical protein [Dongia sp. agr-C8]